jgi:hypothetical protein
MRCQHRRHCYRLPTARCRGRPQGSGLAVLLGGQARPTMSSQRSPSSCIQVTRGYLSLDLRDRDLRPGFPRGVLWTTHSERRWRVWSINKSGDVVLSEARRFVH